MSTPSPVTDELCASLASRRMKTVVKKLYKVSTALLEELPLPLHRYMQARTKVLLS